MAKNRTYNAIINSLFGIGASCITIFLNFFVRIVLVKQLGSEVNGLHNLFQSIASVMTMMELGISSAMIIHLYEPVAKGNKELTKGIMGFYRKTYFGIACVFGVVTVLVAFFLLDILVTTTIDMRKVRLFFIIFGCSFVANYLTYYKRSILYAEQKNRISTSVTAGCELAFRSLQILTLFLFKNYIVFLVLWIVEKTTGNIIVTVIVNRNHPSVTFLISEEWLLTGVGEVEAGCIEVDDHLVNWLNAHPEVIYGSQKARRVGLTSWKRRYRKRLPSTELSV